mgnify:FL=1
MERESEWEIWKGKWGIISKGESGDMWLGVREYIIEGSGNRKGEIGRG